MASTRLGPAPPNTPRARSPGWPEPAQIRGGPPGDGGRVATAAGGDGAGVPVGWRRNAAFGVAPGSGCRVRVQDGDVSDLTQTDGARGAGQRGQVGYAVRGRDADGHGQHTAA